MKTIAMILVTTVVLFLCCGAAHAGLVSGKLSPAELERVKKGEILLKNDIAEGKDSGAGIGYGVFHCKIETFWKIVYDYPQYARMFPPTAYAKIIKGDTGGRFLTEIQMKFLGGLYKMTYTTYNEPAAEKLRLDFGLEKAYPHDRFKDMTGYWQLEKIGEDTYLAEYKVNVQLDLPAGIKDVAQKIVNTLAGKDLPKMFEAFRKEILLREKK